MQELLLVPILLFYSSVLQLHSVRLNHNQIDINIVLSSFIPSLSNAAVSLLSLFFFSVFSPSSMVFDASMEEIEILVCLNQYFHVPNTDDIRTILNGWEYL